MPHRFNAFALDQATAMRDAFHAACDSLAGQDLGDPAWVREVLALRIIDRALTGERDVTRLRDDALVHLKKQKPA